MMFAVIFVPADMWVQALEVGGGGSKAQAERVRAGARFAAAAAEGRTMRDGPDPRCVQSQRTLPA